MSKLFSIVLLVITFICSTIVLFIFTYLSYLCFDLFNTNEIKGFLTFSWDVYKDEYGVATMLLSSFLISFLALFLGFIFSFSISSIIFLSNNSIVKNFLEKTVLMMAAVPTVIYAFAALFTLVPFISTYINPSSTLSILVSFVVLSLLLVPTMSLIFLNVFRSLSLKYKKTCLNLALTSDDFFFKFILKNSFKDLSMGVILALARALGDTMIVLMLAGNALSFPNSVFDSTRSLTSHIALIFANDYDSLAFKAIFFCAFLLISSNFLLIFIVKYIKRAKYE
jgi:phosphate transport system permease protein